MSNEVITILVDDETEKKIHTTIFGRKPKLPKKLSEEQFQLFEYRMAKLYAYRRLAKKNQPSTELKQALVTRFVSEETASQIIQELRQKGYLNDEEWIETFVRYQLERRRGPRDIEMKLRSKGIPEELIEQVLKDLDNSEDRKERIRELIQKKYHEVDFSDFHQKQKVIAALSRRGYSVGEIHEVLRDGHY